MPSSVVTSFSYDPATLTLRVHYISGLIYDYKNVPEKVFKEMKASGSKGRYLNFNIKGKFEYEKVSGSISAGDPLQSEEGAG